MKKADPFNGVKFLGPRPFTFMRDRRFNADRIRFRYSCIFMEPLPTPPPPTFPPVKLLPPALPPP